MLQWHRAMDFCRFVHCTPTHKSEQYSTVQPSYLAVSTSRFHCMRKPGGGNDAEQGSGLGLNPT
jgi:hypothetical protein